MIATFVGSTVAAIIAMLDPTTIGIAVVTALAVAASIRIVVTGSIAMENSSRQRISG